MAEELPGELKSLSQVEASSGRLSFMGVDMAFLIVNGVQMFTLHEILKKILPNTPRTTVCTRLEKMKAVRHACSKEEIRILKGLGGVRRTAINCAMIARKDIVVYCEKFTDENSGEDTLSPCLFTPATSKSIINRGFAKPKNTQGTDAFDSAKHKDKDEAHQTTNLKYKSDASKNVSLFVDNKPNVFGVESVNSPNPLTLTLVADVQSKQHAEVWSARDPVNSCVDEDKPDGKLLQAKGTSSRDVILTSEVDSHKQNLTSTTTYNQKLVKKTRKRRTNLEILESYNGEISCGIIYNKRQRKVCNFENGTWVRPKTKLPVNRADLPVSTQDKNQVGETLDVVVGEGVGDKDSNLGFQLDNNNNVQPHSPPKFLLKRSLNNEWRIASSGVGCLGLQTPTTTSPGKIKALESRQTNTVVPLTTTSSAAQADHQGNLHNAKSRKKLLPANLKKNTSTGKKVGLGTSMKIKKKRGSTAEMVKTEVQETTAIEVEVKLNDTTKLSKETTVDLQPNGPVAVENETTPSKSNLFTADKDFKIMPRVRTPIKELSTIVVEKTKINKPVVVSEDVNKPKRRRRTQVHTFRLVETIPYSSLLMVKDGDLCPAYTMIYSSNKSDPGCCHPLWRWRLGKPVSPAKQPRISASPVKQPQSEICDEDLEHQEQGAPLTKDNNVNIDCPSIVNVSECEDDNNS